MRSIFVRTYATLASMVLVALVATWAWGLATRGPDPHFRDLALNGPLTVLESFAALPDDRAVARIRDELGWRPTRDLDDAIRSAWDALVAVRR